MPRALCPFSLQRALFLLLLHRGVGRGPAWASPGQYPGTGNWAFRLYLFRACAVLVSSGWNEYTFTGGLNLCPRGCRYTRASFVCLFAFTISDILVGYWKTWEISPLPTRGHHLVRERDKVESLLSRKILGQQVKQGSFSSWWGSLERHTSKAPAGVLPPRPTSLLCTSLCPTVKKQTWTTVFLFDKNVNPFFTWASFHYRPLSTVKTQGQNRSVKIFF